MRGWVLALLATGLLGCQAPGPRACKSHHAWRHGDGSCIECGQRLNLRAAQSSAHSSGCTDGCCTGHGVAHPAPMAPAKPTSEPSPTTTEPPASPPEPTTDGRRPATLRKKVLG